MNHLTRFQPILELLADDRPGGTLLDVGSGSHGIAALLPANWRAVSLDANFEDYGAARRPSVARADQVIGDVRELPFPDRAFDAVVAIDLLEHLASSIARRRSLRSVAWLQDARSSHAPPAQMRLARIAASPSGCALGAETSPLGLWNTSTTAFPSDMSCCNRLRPLDPCAHSRMKVSPRTNA